MATLDLGLLRLSDLTLGPPGQSSARRECTHTHVIKKNTKCPGDELPLKHMSSVPLSLNQTTSPSTGSLSRSLTVACERRPPAAADSHEHEIGGVFVVLAVDHCDLMNSCPEDEPMTPSEECVDAATDESLLETNPIQSPLQVFAGMGGLALIAERLPMLYPDVMQQVTGRSLITSVMTRVSLVEAAHEQISLLSFLTCLQGPVWRTWPDIFLSYQMIAQLMALCKISQFWFHHD